MTCTKDINCLVGDIIKFYKNIRCGILRETISDPNHLMYEIDLDTKKEGTSLIFATDGEIKEIDHARVGGRDGRVPFLSKSIRIENATYAVVVKFTILSGAYMSSKVNVFAKDQDTLEKLYREVPNDLYFV